MNTPERPNRDDDDFGHDGPVADLLHLLEQPVAACGAADAPHRATRDTGDGDGDGDGDGETEPSWRGQAFGFVGVVTLPIGAAVLELGTRDDVYADVLAECCSRLSSSSELVIVGAICGRGIGTAIASTPSGQGQDAASAAS